MVREDWQGGQHMPLLIGEVAVYERRRTRAEVAAKWLLIGIGALLLIGAVLVWRAVS